MKNQIMTTIGQFGLASHEMRHMRFGYNVTCATLSDIWVNEGVAGMLHCWFLHHITLHIIVSRKT
nr:hypothetical protein [Bacteroidota bacterium]